MDISWLRGVCDERGDVLMPMKYIAFVVFIWVAGALMGAILDNAYLTSSDNVTLNQVMQASKVHMPVSGGQDVNLLAAGKDVFTTVWKMATLDFSFLHGEWQLLRWFVFGPLAAMIVYGLVMMFINILQKTF